MPKFNIAPPDEATAAAELIDIIETLPRFALVFAQCASDATAEDHIKHFEQMHPNLNLVRVAMVYPDGRIYAHLSDIYERDTPDTIFITGMEAWTERDENAGGNEFTLGLNHARDFLHESVRCPLVLWVTPTVYNHIRRNAQDFFSIATATLRFSMPDAESENRTRYDKAPYLIALLLLTQDEREARIRELEELMHHDTAQTINTVDNNEEIRLRHHLGVLYFIDGRYLDARNVLLQARQISAGDADKYSELADLIESLASIAFQLGQFVDAQEYLEEAIAITDIRGERETSTNVIHLTNLATLELFHRNFEKSREWADKALALSKALLGGRHPYTAFILSLMGQMEVFSGNYAEAKGLLEIALAIAEETVGTQNLLTAHIMCFLSELAYRMGDNAQAQALAEQCLGIFEKVEGIAHLYKNRIYYLLSDIYKAQGKEDQAAEMLAKAMSPAPGPSTI